MRSKFALSIILLLGAFLQVSATQERFAGRITATVDERSRTVVQGHLHPLAQPRLDRGRVDPLLTLSRVTMMFKRTTEQQAALDAFLQEQQDPSSRNYQLWLTPEEFADRFGLSVDDINKVASWLQSHGFKIEEIARSRTWIAFSGTAEQVHSAFQTEIHHYVVDGVRHYAPASEPSVPSALAGVVLGLRSLDDFRLKPRLKTTRASSHRVCRETIS